MTKIKIVYIVDSLSGGGAETQLNLLTRNLGSDYEPVIYCLSRHSEVIPEFNNSPISIKRFEIDNLFTWKGYKEWRRMTMELRVDNPVIVQTQLFTSDLAGLTAAWLARIPLRISSRRDMGFWQHTGHRLIYRLLLNSLAKRIIGNSLSITQNLISKDEKHSSKYITINNGIDLDRFKTLEFSKRIKNRQELLSLNEDETAVCIVASLTEVKGHRYFLEAAKQLFKKNPKTRFFIFGQGPLENELKTYTKQQNIEPYIHFMGRIDEMEHYYPLMDIVISSSVSEGTSNTILEAKASGVAVVATAVGGSVHLIHDSIDGLLVPPKDSIELAKAMKRLIDDKELLVSIRNRGVRQIHEEFSVSSLVKSYINLYRELGNE